MGRKAAIAAEASLPSPESKALWRARIEAVPGPETPTDADLREAMDSYHRLDQEELSRQSLDWYFATLPGFAAAREEDLVGAFSSAMFPALCDEQVARRVDDLLASGTKLPAGLSEQRIPAGDYACTLHVGPYESLPDVWGRLMNEWLPSSGYRVPDGGLSYELYLNDPSQVSKDQLRTELCAAVVRDI